MLRAPCSVLRAPCSVLRAPCSVLRAPCSVLRAPANGAAVRRKAGSRYRMPQGRRPRGFKRCRGLGLHALGGAHAEGRHAVTRRGVAPPQRSTPPRSRPLAADLAGYWLRQAAPSANVTDGSRRGARSRARERGPDGPAAVGWRPRSRGSSSSLCAVRTGATFHTGPATAAERSVSVRQPARSVAHDTRAACAARHPYKLVRPRAGPQPPHGPRALRTPRSRRYGAQPWPAGCCSVSGRMSMRQPVRRAARRAFWPSLPMASESW